MRFLHVDVDRLLCSSKDVNVDIRNLFADAIFFDRTRRAANERKKFGERNAMMELIFEQSSAAAAAGSDGVRRRHHLVMLAVMTVMSIVPVTSSGLYEGGATASVVDLHPTNFRRSVIESDDIWIVEFYAPWCGHCKALVPEYTKAAEALKGIAKVGAVNVDQHGSLGSDYGVQGFPTIKIFGVDKGKPDEYKGARKAKEMVNAVLEALRVLAHGRLGIGGKPTGDSTGKSKSSSDGKEVVELTDANFEELVLNSEDMWLVEFFAPWCGHCKNLEPHWASAASELRGKVKLGALDSTVHTVMASRYGVRGYPTIKYFAPGKKDKSADDYDGGRTSGDIVQWATEKLAANIPPPDVIQVTSDDILKSACEDHQLCIVSVLPHILDCQSQCRNDYLNVLKKLGDKFKKHMWGWVWTEGGSQVGLEESLGIGGFGYPAMAAMNSRKMKYTLLRGSFSFDGINEFLKELAFGRASTLPVKGAKLPSIEALAPWDGKDGKLDIVEEDVDDIELDKEEL